MKFSAIKGLDRTKERLRNAVKEDKIAHAQLFLGKKGCPNLPLALAYISYVNCESRTDNDSCGTCPSCVKIAKHVHPDVHFVFPVSSTKNVASKEASSLKFLPEWRKFLLETPYGSLEDWTMAYGGENKQVNISKEESRTIIKDLSLKSFEGRYKVMLIWLPEYMHPSAANGILKILEEPPEKTLFLLVSNNQDRLLTTILSRTQIVHVPTFNDEELSRILIEDHQTDEKRAKEAARLADGSLIRALSLTQSLDTSQQEAFASWMRACFQHEFDKLVGMAEDFHRSSKLEQRSLLEYGLFVFRESLIYQQVPELVQSGTDKFIANFSKVVTLEKAEIIAQLLNEAHYHLERNASAKMVHLDLSLQIAKSIK